jgi:hypothetical protein
MAGRLATKISRAKSPFSSGLVGSAVLTVGVEAANAIAVGIQLKGTDGKNLSQRAAVRVYISGANTGAGLVGTAPTGGVAISVGNTLSVLTAGKEVNVVTDGNGAVTATLTDTGTPTFYVVVVLPDGSIAVSPAVTFA